MKIKKLLKIKTLLLEFVNSKLPFQLAYKLYKFLKIIENEESAFTPILNQILGEYGMIDKNGDFIRDNDGNIKIKENMIKECNQALNELNNIECDVPNIMFTLEELSPLNLSINDIELLNNFIGGNSK